MSAPRLLLRPKVLLSCLGAGLLLAALALMALFMQAGWVAIEPDDARLTPSMRLALSGRTFEMEAGRLRWRQLAQGFEVSELPVLVADDEVDRILLARIDPGRFRFEVRTAPTGHTGLNDWASRLGAALVVNGSFFTPDGRPDTPVISNGNWLGPQEYDADHGAFIASPDFVGVRDLAGGNWHSILKGADHAMVSYPLLVAADGSTRTKSDSRWLANRSFIAHDRSGRIIVGTTTEAFFSLERLAEFLRDSPLDLLLALNLDGGPVACQAIRLDDFRRDFCGTWETATHDGQLKMLRSVSGFGVGRSNLPVVLAVFPR